MGALDLVARGSSGLYPSSHGHTTPISPPHDLLIMAAG